MKSIESRTNPWLTIPAKDYEAHMGSPQVGQLDLLNRVFRDLLAYFRPASLAVAGCTTGNGFERIDFAVTTRVVAIDINESYLQILRQRYGRHAQNIETIPQDINAVDPAPQTFELVHCALIFEYVDAQVTLKNLRKWLSPRGTMSVVLQIPNPSLETVTDTPQRSLRRLAPAMRLITPGHFRSMALSNRLMPRTEEFIALKSGKEFYVGTYSPCSHDLSGDRVGASPAEVLRVGLNYAVRRKRMLLWAADAEESARQTTTFRQIAAKTKTSMNITQLLAAVEGGDEGAADQLPQAVYNELRRLAAQKLANERPGQTLQATALVHEAFIRLIGGPKSGWQSRSHFFGAAAEAMRRILVEAARRKARIKHGGELKRQEFDEQDAIVTPPSTDLLALNEALDKFTRENPTKAKLVQLRFFTGLTVEEAGKILDISRATADRYWAYARAWLYNEIAHKGHSEDE